MSHISSASNQLELPTAGLHVVIPNQHLVSFAGRLISCRTDNSVQWRDIPAGAITTPNVFLQEINFVMETVFNL
jgi:hypothetical protein